MNGHGTVLPITAPWDGHEGIDLGESHPILFDV